MSQIFGDIHKIVFKFAVGRNVWKESYGHDTMVCT